MWLTLCKGWVLLNQKEAVHISHIAYREDSLPNDEKDDIHQAYLILIMNAYEMHYFSNKYEK
jgi:hypothetical protein